jgi:hypothetical protein
MLNWHVERLDTDGRAMYERVIEQRPQLDPYHAIGIACYIEHGASWGFIAKLAGLRPGQLSVDTG